MCPVNPEQSHRAFRKALHRTVDQRQPASKIDSASVLQAIRQAPGQENFSEFLLTNDQLDRIAKRARDTGLTLQDIQTAAQAAARHVALEHEFIKQHEFRQEVAEVATHRNFFLRLAGHLKTSLRSASFYDSSVPSGGAVENASSMTEAVIASAVEQQILNKRYDQYMALGGKVFRQTVEQYQAGQLTYQELLDHPTYVVGIRTITEALPIEDDFVLDRDTGIFIDAYDPDVKTAIRRHLAFILKSEIAHTAELRALGVVSTPDTPEYVTRAQEQPRDTVAKVKQFFSSGLPMRLARLLRVVATDATLWSFGGAYAGGQLAALSLHDPHQLVTAGLVTTGAIMFGAGARVLRNWPEAALRLKQRRTEISMGTLGHDLVPNADRLGQQLLDQAKHLLSHPNLNARERLYHTIAHVRARLRRSREGNKPPHSDPNKGPLRIERPPGKPLTDKGPMRIVRPKKADPDPTKRPDQPTVLDEPERFDPNQPKQDYINFGVANRFASQQQLAEALGYALSVLERSQLPDTTKEEKQLKKQWLAKMKAIDQEAEQAVDQAQAAIDKAIQHYEDQYRKEALKRGGTAGLISGLAVSFLPVPYGAALLSEWAAGRKPLVIQRTKYRARMIADDPSYVARDTSGREVADLELPDLKDTYEVARTERLDKTRSERERTARQAIRQAVDIMERQYAETLDALQVLLRAIRQTGAMTPEQMHELAGYGPALSDIARQRDPLQRLLDQVDEDISYREIDADEDSRLAKLLAEVDTIATLGKPVQQQITLQGTRLEQEADQVRRYTDYQMPPASRHQQLELITQRLAELQANADQFHPGLLKTAAHQTLLRNFDRLGDRLAGAIAMITIAEYCVSDKVADPLRQALVEAGVVTANDLTQPVVGQERKAACIARALARQPATTEGFKTLGFMRGSGPLVTVQPAEIRAFIQQC